MDGHAHMLAINVLAPYLLTALVAPPPRLVYLSGGMHRGGTPSIDDLDWGRRQWNGAQAYSASKLFDATFTAAVARRWPGVLSNAVEPGWVPTKMGGPGAPDDLAQAPGWRSARTGRARQRRLLLPPRTARRDARRSFRLVPG
jgi:NAD(P)-dependent dehydrogenase (short-subunit alcohol dehydrogenase family)